MKHPIMRATAALLGAVAGISMAATPLPVETFYKDLQFSDLAISPNGDYVAALMQINGAHNVVVLDFATKTPKVLTPYLPPATVRAVYWKSYDRLIYEATMVDIRGNSVSNIGAVNRDGKNHLMVFDNRNAKQGGYFSEKIVDLKIDDPRNILLASSQGTPFFPAIYDTDTADLWHPMHAQAEVNKLPFDTRRIKIAAAPGRNCDYTTDTKGVVRACISTELDLSRNLLYRASTDSAWQTIAHFSDKTGYLIPLGFAPDNATLYVLSNIGRDTQALYEFDPAARTLGKLLFEVPGVDLAGGVYSADHRRLTGVHYVSEGSHTYFLDKFMAELQAELQKDFPDYALSIISQSLDGKRAIVLVANERTPGKFYLYDGTKEAVTYIVDRAPWINPKLMSEVRAVKFHSRDGLELRGYLTLPAGREAKNLPLIVYPHGGPFEVRDTDRWDPDVQFFASRGYAVLQINFRGSGGYGAAFTAAGYGEMGGKMQDDITDGAEWAIKEGIVDRSRIAIYGSSYGGYAALMGLITTPDLYRCGISYSGLSDLTEIFNGLVIANSLQRERSREELTFWAKTIGHRDDSAYLRSHSPIYNVEKIRAPVFIAHGVDDMVIPYRTATALRDALKSASKPVEFFSRPDEAHGFFKETNNVALFTQIDQFLQQCNPANR